MLRGAFREWLKADHVRFWSASVSLHGAVGRTHEIVHPERETVVTGDDPDALPERTVEERDECDDGCLIADEIGDVHHDGHLIRRSRRCPACSLYTLVAYLAPSRRILRGSCNAVV